MVPVQRSAGAALARKIVFFVLKVGVAGGLIYWLIERGFLDFSLLETLRLDAATVTLALAAALCVAVGLLLLAWRFQLLLRFTQINVSYGRALGLTLIGSFFGAVLPGLVGGDVVKAVYACADAPGRRADAVAAVMIDRAIGLYALMLLGAAALGASLVAGMLPFENPVLWAAPLAILAGTFGMALMAWPRFRQLRLIQALFDRAPQKVQNLLKALTRYVKQPRVLVQAVGLSLANHALVVLSFFVVGQMLRLEDAPSAFTHFVLNPLAMAINAVALTPGGLGLTEGAFAGLFSLAGFQGGAMIGLMGRAVQYGVFAISGTAALMLIKAGRRRPRPDGGPEKA
jgi:glycosyltransferase 2 family protein